MESLSELLNQHGIDNEKANLIQNRINGSELMDLISFLKDGSPEALNNADKILSNFGVKIMEAKTSFNKIIKTSKNIISHLVENNIPYRKYGSMLYAISLTESNREDLENILKENKMNYKSRIMELAGIVPGITTFGADNADTTTIDTTDNGLDDNSVVTTVSDDDGDADFGDSNDLDLDVSSDTVDGQSTIVPPANSVEFNQIVDYLNNIQQLIPDVRVSEFKTLQIKIQDLYNQSQGMGGSYLQ